VFHNLEKPIWFGLKKNFFIGWGGVEFFHFLGILPKKGFLGFFSAKIGLQHSAYILNQRKKTLPENIGRYNMHI
jgi:hypothetical protein